MFETQPPGRTCAIAAQRGRHVRCRPGGCVLARLLEPGRAELPEPCVVERLAEGALDNPLVVFCLDELREELDEAHAVALGRPALRP